jgi:transcriptional regulator with XRE-family HTH domain
MMIRPMHLRMARAALDLSLKELAEKADVNMNTISRYESGSQVMSGTISKIEAALLREGVIFLEDEGELGPGVRLKRQLSLAVTDAAQKPKQMPKQVNPKSKRKR